SRHQAGETGSAGDTRRAGEHMKSRAIRRIRGLVGIAVFAPLAGGLGARPVPQTMPLQAEAMSILAGASGEWGVFAWAIDSGRPLFGFDATKALIPASNNKVFTSIWALDMLGADHRFATDLLLTGPVENGVLRGAVVIRGSGDPAF